MNAAKHIPFNKNSDNKATCEERINETMTSELEIIKPPPEATKLLAPGAIIPKNGALQFEVKYTSGNVGNNIQRYLCVSVVPACDNDLQGCFQLLPSSVDTSIKRGNGYNEAFFLVYLLKEEEFLVKLDVSIRRCRKDEVIKAVIRNALYSRNPIITFEEPLRIERNEIFGNNIPVFPNKKEESKKLIEEAKSKWDTIKKGGCILSLQIFEQSGGIPQPVFPFPVLSNEIRNSEEEKKRERETNVMILRMIRNDSPAKGMKELWIHTSPLPQGGIKVIFESEDKEWKEEVIVPDREIQKKSIFIIRAPKYMDQEIANRVEVSIRLEDMLGKRISAPVAEPGVYVERDSDADKHRKNSTFVYFPNDDDHDGLKRKRMKALPEEFLQSLHKIPKLGA